MDRAIRQQAQAQLPEVVPRRDRVSQKPAVQPAKMIVRVAFRRSFVKITVPLDLDSYHTALDEKETGIRAQNFLEMDSSHRLTLHGELDRTGQVLRPGVSPAGASFWKEGARPRRG